MPQTTVEEKTATSSKKDSNQPDFSKPGWPGLSKYPFVEPEYYESFPEKLRPRFQPGSLTSMQLSYDATRMAQQQWEKPFELITVVNLNLKGWSVHIPGPQPGQIVGVTVPPMGVLRGPLQKELTGGMSGSRFPLRGAIAPMGDCKNSLSVKDADGAEFTTCRYHSCPHHPMGGMAHSVQMAYHFISSIGEALPDPRDPQHTAAYVPPVDYAEKELWKYQNLDPRPEVTVWAAKRLMYIKTREARFNVMESRGQSVPGR